VTRVSALDPAAVDTAIRDAAPEVIIDELTSLARNPANMAESFRAIARFVSRAAAICCAPR
jgi:hypothetical protein